jgi:hypothetical protein
MQAMVRVELGVVFGAALKLSIAMLAFEGIVWVAALSAPAGADTLLAANPPQTGQTLVAELSECGQAPAEPPVLIAAGPRSHQPR